MSRWSVPFAVLLALAAPTFAQLSPDKALASMTAADGLQVELFAAEPLLINPTSMDVDHLGRVWVTEAVNYRRKLFGRPMLRPEGDRIVILTDTDGDGKADTSTVFYQAPDLYGPLGIAVAKDAAGPGYKVFVCQSPDILVFTDKDGDGKADGPPTKLLTGFGGYDHDHGVHGVNIGPDGKLYFTVGDEGVGRGKGPDGKPVPPLKASDGKGRAFVSNGTDCRAGTVWRCDFDGTNLELIAHNFRNNYECCVDSFGEIWLSDNDDDGNQQTRICFVMPGGDYGYHPRGAGESHWHEEQPGVVHKTLRTGFGSPTGICFYEGTLLPEKYRGQLLHTDAGPRELRAFKRKPKGAGYELEKEVLLTSTDNWFRPSDVCVGPDGSVFVADWYDPGVGGHGMGDWTRGRVYRLTPKGHKGYKPPGVTLDTKEGKLAAIGNPNNAVRHLAAVAYSKVAIKELHDLPLHERLLPNPKTKGLAAPNEAVLQARLRWASIAPLLELCRGSTGGQLGKGGAYLMGMLALAANQEPETDADRAAMLSQIVRVTRTFIAGIPGDVLQPQEASSGSLIGMDLALITMDWKRPHRPPAFDRELLIQHANVPVTRKFIVEFYKLAKLYDGHDRFYRAALNIACGTERTRRDAILADFDKHFPEWNDAVADLVWELRPASAFSRLDKLLDDPKLTPAQKARVVDVQGEIDVVGTGQRFLDLLTGDAPPEVKARALDNLKRYLPTKWDRLALSSLLTDAVDKLLADPKTTVTGLQLVAAAKATRRATAVGRVALDAAAPAEVRGEAVRTLGALNYAPEAADALTALMNSAPMRDDPLADAAATALGRLVSGAPNVQRAALTGLQTKLLEGGGTPDRLSRTILSALAGSRSGTDWLLKQKEQNAIPADLVAETGRLLRNSPFQGERNKAMILFPAPTKLDPKKLPSPADLAKRRGNADNGRAILAKSAAGESQCLKCHTVNGQGGRIGPDLSAIGKKGSRENLFESILQPSKAIADQFASWTIDTADGQTITGLVVGETEKAVTVRDANGKDYPIPVKDIEKRRKSLVSLMPDNLAAALTEDELVDLVEYLTTLRTEPPK